MDQSVLTYETMTEISTRLSELSGNMESELNQVKTQFDKIGGEDVWSGTAASEAKTTFDKLSAKFPEFVTAIAECSEYIARVVDLYQSVDNQAVTGADSEPTL